jgi:hypothetical protein
MGFALNFAVADALTEVMVLLLNADSGAEGAATVWALLLPDAGVAEAAADDTGPDEFFCDTPDRGLGAPADCGTGVDDTAGVFVVVRWDCLVRGDAAPTPDFVGPELLDPADGDDDAPPVPESAEAATGIEAMAPPMPKATARAPTRPIDRAFPDALAKVRRGKAAPSTAGGRGLRPRRCRPRADELRRGTSAPIESTELNRQSRFLAPALRSDSDGQTDSAVIARSQTT